VTPREYQRATLYRVKILTPSTSNLQGGPHILPIISNTAAFGSSYSSTYPRPPMAWLQTKAGFVCYPNTKGASAKIINLRFLGPKEYREQRALFIRLDELLHKSGLEHQFPFCTQHQSFPLNMISLMIALLNVMEDRIVLIRVTLVCFFARDAKSCHWPSAQPKATSFFALSIPL